MASTELSSEGRAFVQDAVSLGMRIMARYGVDTARSVLANLDLVFEAWRQDDRHDRPPPGEVAVGLGAVLGDRLAASTTLRWCIVTDEHGTDYAMSTPDGLTIYPIAFVQKRLAPDNDERDIFSGFYSVLQDRWGDRLRPR